MLQWSWPWMTSLYVTWKKNVFKINLNEKITILCIAWLNYKIICIYFLCIKSSQRYRFSPFAFLPKNIESLHNQDCSYLHTKLLPNRTDWLKNLSRYLQIYYQFDSLKINSLHNNLYSDQHWNTRIGSKQHHKLARMVWRRRHLNKLWSCCQVKQQFMTTFSIHNSLFSKYISDIFNSLSSFLLGLKLLCNIQSINM